MILERRIKKRNLNRLDILINDTSNEFLQVFDIVDTLPQGRSSFTINGSEFLKTNTEVLVEILDNSNNPIYVNAIFDPEYVTMQGTSRSISVEVYPTTPAGRAVLTIIGELDHKKFIGNQPLTPELLAQLNIETDPIFTGEVSIAKAVAENFFIPTEYQGVYNVKYNKVIQINPRLRNTQPIKFYRKPQIQVRELIRTEIEASSSNFLDIVNVSTGSISGKRINPEKTLRLVNPAEIDPVRAIISCDSKLPPQGGYTDAVGPNTLNGTIYNRAYPLEVTSEDSYGSIIRRSWEFGDTHTTESFSVPDATNPKGVEKQTHTFTKPGTYKVKLTTASPTGQYDLDTETVTLSAPSAPVAEFTVAHPTASTAGSTKTTGSMEDDKGRTFKFRDTSTNVDNIVDPLVFGSKFSNINDTEYSWSFGDGNTANGLGAVSRNPIHTYVQSGSYTVALTVKNNYGTQTNTETKTNHILIKPSIPIVDFSVNSGSITEVQAVGASAAAILGATATFTNSTVYYGSSITYAWTFNSSGSTSTATSPTCIYTGSTYVADTTFDVTLVATDNFGRSVTKTKKNLISVTPSIPAPNFTANVQEFTLTGSFEAKRIEFTDTSTSDSTLTYKYDFNGGTTGSNLNSHAGSTTFEAANLTGGRFEAGVGSPLTLGITFENPRAGTRCLKLTNGGSSLVSDPYTYGYDYGNSGESTLAAWISQYSLATITRNHMYTMEFWARADEPTTLMTGMFGANANGHIFGSGPAQGTFAIKGQKVGTSWQKFNWTFKFTDVGCRYLTIRLGADTLNAGKAVYFDNVEVYKSTSTVKDPRIDYRTKTDGARGLIKQSVTNTAGTERSIQIPNFINAQFGAPSASFVIDDSTILTQVPVTFNASGSNGFTNISEYRWDWGDGDFDTTPNSVITHKYSSAATYVPKLTVVSPEGQSTQVNRGNVVVSAPAAPTVSLGFMDGSTTTGEAPHEILVKATTANQVTSSNITFGNGDSTNSTRGFTVYKVPGVFTITATVTGPGGSASDTLTMTVSSPPEAATEETAEDPEPEVTKDVQKAAETGTNLGSGGGSDPNPPAPYTGGGGGGDPYTGCVLAGTIIKTARGDVPVEQVTTDDLVYSWDFNKKEFGYYNIEKAWTKKQPIRVFVETESGKSVECSDTHLFYHPDYKDQEICIKDLNVGDIVYSLNDDGKIFEDPIKNIITYDDEEVEVYNFNVPEIYSYITNDIISHNKEKYESGASDPLKTQFEMNLASPETDVFEIETDQTGEFFKQEMLGAELTIFPSVAGTDMEALNSGVPTDRQFVIKQQPLVTKIRKIGPNGRIITPDIRGLMVTNRLNSHKGVVFSEYQDFGPSGYSMSYQQPVTSSFRVINKLSLSKINLTQLRPYSGEISRVKVYYKTAGDVGGYKLLKEINALKKTELLADKTPPFNEWNIGVFEIQQHIDYYWFGRQGENAGFFEGVDSTSPTAGLTWVNKPYPKMMRISGSNYPHNSVVSTFHKYPLRLVAGTEYAMSFHLAGIKKNKQHTPENAAATGNASEQAAKIKFYVSGSSLKPDDGWGHLLGVMELDTYGAVSESFEKVEHNFIARNNGDGRLQLVVESGEWYIKDISVSPMMESGFSPDFTSTVDDTPKLSQRPSILEYYAEFFDYNGNASNLMAIGQSPKKFVGSSQIIEGVDNTLSGSLFLGGDAEGSGIEIHGGSSYVRNVGYVGYHSASQQQSVDDPTLGKAGFMMWSGSILTDTTDEYSDGDVGFEIHGGPGVKDGSAGAMRFRSSTGKLEVTGSIVATEGHFSKNFSVGTGSAAIEISSSKYIMKTKNWNHPTSSKGWAISGSGQAYFQEGYIGGWQIKSIDEGTSTERAIISGSNITLDAGGAALYMSNKGPGSDSGATFPVLADEYYLDFTPDSSQAVTSANYYVSFGPKFKIDKEGTMFASGAKFVGTITASAGKLGGFNIGSASMFGGSNEGIPDFFLSGSQGHGSTGYNKSNLFLSSSGFQVTHDGALKATSGSIGGWTIIDNMLKSSDGNMRINAGNQKITINSHTFGNEGIQIDYNSGTPRMYVGDGSNEFLKWDGSNLSFKGASSELSTAGAFTATAGAIGGWTLASTSLSAGSGGTYIALIPGTGIQMGHGTFGSAPFSVTNAGFVSATSGKIGGWNVGANSISSSNLNISSTGLLETSDYASGFKGWRISSQDNGFAEFENVRIRGTLKTAVFEKETVNAVGGQLYIANSTTITGSHDVGVSDTTIQLANASGFAAGEVLTIKKVTATGFGTEYVRVVSAARVDAGSDTNMSGSIVVIRQYGRVSVSGSGASGSLGDAPGAGQTYGPGQVVVSTGKLGTGYIRLNANPNDQTTPYMDIVERTGSGVYDVELKARLGDLSGLSAAQLQGTSAANAGFGLYSQNVFLTGGIIAQTGSIGGVKMQNEKLYVGTGTYDNSNTGYFLSSSGAFSLGDKLVWDGSNLDITGTITLTGGQSLGAAAYYSASAPSASGEGDVWYDSDDGNKPYIATGPGTSNWQEVADDTIATAQTAVDAIETQVVLSSAGMLLKNQAGTTLADYGADAVLTGGSITLRSSANNNDKFVLTADSAKFYDNNNEVGSFGATTTIGNTSNNEYVNIDTNGVKIYGGASDDYAFMDADSFSIVQGGTTISDFGSTVVIGEVGSSKSNVQITSGAINLRNNTTNKMVLGADGTIAIGSHFSVDASGNGSFSGTLTVGGTTLDATNTLNANTTAGNVGLGNVDNTSAANIQAGTTAANVGLGNVDNTDSQGTAQAGLISGTTITGGGITLSGGGSIKSTGKDSASDTTNGFFLGHDGASGYDFAIGDATKSLIWDGSAATLVVKGEIQASGGSFTGNVTAGSVTIGTSGITGTGYTINADGIQLSGASTLSIGSSNSIFRVDSDGDMWIGNATQGSAPFQVTKTGVITATSGTVGGWTLGSTTLTGGDKVLLDQGNSKIVIADDVTNISEGITISYGSADVGAGYTANKVHVIAGDDTDIVFNADYGRDFFFTPGRIRQWYIQGGQGGGGSSDPSADSIGNFNTGGSGIAGISGKLYYDAGLVGISSNYGGNMTDNEVNSAIFGWNSRGASGTVCAGVHGLVNRGNVAGVLGEAYGWGSDTSDMAENLVSGLFRGGAFIVGNAYTSSASDQSNNDVDYALIAYPRTKYGATHENRVGINKRQPTVALDVIGEIKASSNITAYSDRRAKKNIELISGSLGLINKLRGVYFDWKKPEEIAPDRYGKKLVDNPLGRQVGMIAQEVQLILPELVEHDEDDQFSLKYSNIVAVLTNAVNELTDKVNKQEKQIKELYDGKT